MGYVGEHKVTYIVMRMVSGSIQGELHLLRKWFVSFTRLGQLINVGGNRNQKRLIIIFWNMNFQQNVKLWCDVIAVSKNFDIRGAIFWSPIPPVGATLH